MIKLFVLAMTLSGCGMASLNIVAPDGTKTSALGYRLGTDQAVKDLTITVNKDGSRSMTLGSSDSNQTSGLKDANALLGTITSSAFWGAEQIGEKPTHRIWVRYGTGTKPEDLTGQHVVDWMSGNQRFRIIRATNAGDAQKFTVILLQAESATVVHLDGAQTIASMAFWVAKGCITADRSLEILA